MKSKTFAKKQVSNEHFATYWWEWDRKAVKQILKANKELYLFGNANRNETIADLFDKVYYLKANRNLVSERLRSERRKNRFGKGRKQREMVLSWIPSMDRKAKEHGFICVDVSMSPKKIFDFVIGDGNQGISGPVRIRSGVFFSRPRAK